MPAGDAAGSDPGHHGAAGAVAASGARARRSIRPGAGGGPGEGPRCPPRTSPCPLASRCPTGPPWGRPQPRGWQEGTPEGHGEGRGVPRSDSRHRCPPPPRRHRWGWKRSSAPSQRRRGGSRAAGCRGFGLPVPRPPRRRRGAARRCQPGCPAPVSDPPGGRGLGAYLTSPAGPARHTRSSGRAGGTAGSSAGAMASQLEGAMETLINVFHHYSGKEGDKYKLSKKELKELLQSELGCFLETQKDTGAVEKIMQDLDENGDGEVDFQEYVVLVAALTVACNTFFWENA
ncbi:protein S100-A1 isoform X1 [Mycteria americana]|uniref:protein S100-A1 isoform X1 n=1 Tax=Mycteria americana TaxID=33587 RepID=UPI003F58BA44